MVWYHGIGHQIREGQHDDWDNYDQFLAKLVIAFEPLFEVECAQIAIRNLRQIGRASAYVRKFPGFRFHILDMSQAEMFHPPKIPQRQRNGFSTGNR